MNPFKNVEAAHPKRHAFDLSYSKRFTTQIGKLVPIMCDEVIPGDTFKIGNEVLVRFEPLIAPIMQNIDVTTHYFFVPYRILDDGFEDFITGGVDGDSAGKLASEQAIPLWKPTDDDLQLYSLWDYLGFPIYDVATNTHNSLYPIDYPRRAYNHIYNEYYRDQTLIPEVPLDNINILHRSWVKDYFTSALPFQQRGTAPALPITGSGFTEFFGIFTDTQNYNTTNALALGGAYNLDPNSTLVPFKPIWDSTNAETKQNQANEFNKNMRHALNQNQINLQTTPTFDVNDLRLAFQIQLWMERNARAGARYIEHLKAQFGVAPKDERLQRPEYIGGTKAPVVISEVLQTSESQGSPQGNMAGHGISANGSFAGTYTAYEFGLIMGIMSIMPKPQYQDGINRQWLRQTRYDFPYPIFANLSEQAIMSAELYYRNDGALDEEIFGYQGRFDELRIKHDMICGDFRQSPNGVNPRDISFWTYSRKFGNRPSLNQDFIECRQSQMNQIFADITDDENPFIVSVANLIKAIRPIPELSNPGLIDHAGA